MQVLDVNVVIPELAKMLTPLIGEDVKLEVRLGDGPLTIAIDPGELEQSVLNLVLNARDAMPKGGSLVIATSRGARVEDGANGKHPVEQGVVLTVTDTGTGMDAQTEPRIFEPFFTTKPMGQGTGLGLATVYGIVRRSGGSISVDTGPGEGTTMRLWFPFAVATLEIVAGGEQGLDTSGSETILVVEDDELVRAFVVRALTEAGYETFAAESGHDALTLLQSRSSAVDLVLTDVVMPGLSGPELAERLSLTAPHTRVLFMSGYIDSSFLSAELENHPEALIRKPFTAAELRVRIREMLGRRTADR